MPNTYIKNRGVTQTIVNNNNHKQYKKIANSIKKCEVFEK